MYFRFRTPNTSVCVINILVGNVYVKVFLHVPTLPMKSSVLMYSTLVKILKISFQLKWHTRLIHQELARTIPEHLTFTSITYPISIYIHNLVAIYRPELTKLFR